MTLPPLDIHHVRAAEGWLALGNHLAADEDLKKISLPARIHPRVLMVRWKIYVKARKWDWALLTAETLIETVPDSAVGWMVRSLVLHEMKRTREAWEQLRLAARKFPRNPYLHYNLACYAAQLGLRREARGSLRRAFELDERRQLQNTAPDDPDLKPFWASLRPEVHLAALLPE
jgi:tetratricopeptide (TPR) repeat protein